MSDIFNLIDFILWTIMAASVAYVLFFALASHLPSLSTKRGKAPSGPDLREMADTSDLQAAAGDLQAAAAYQHLPTSADGNQLPTAPADGIRQAPASRFLVLFPAYHEDSVIRASVEAFLKQDYPRDHYKVAVISDHMTDETNSWLARQPITLLTPEFERSSKARALQHAVYNMQGENHVDATHVVILDADNMVEADFLSLLDKECGKGYRAIQCHRTAKNSDTDIAALDGLSEEINNSIFRLGHNHVGLSSALIGSGMCFDYHWFEENVSLLDTAVEDRELEALLLRDNIYIHYAKDIFVKDEKVSTGDSFQRQRLRWMTGQLQALVRMAPSIPRAIAKGNINYIDKTLQQALIPRSILLMGIVAMTIIVHDAKWCLLLLAFATALFIAIPKNLRTKALVSRAKAFPALALRMVKNVARIKPDSNEFIHTEHGGAAALNER